MMADVAITMHDYLLTAKQQLGDLRLREQLEVLELSMRCTLSQYIYWVDEHSAGRATWTVFNCAVNACLADLIELDAMLSELMLCGPRKKFTRSVSNQGNTLH
jgi:hypothetical protein